MKIKIKITKDVLERSKFCGFNYDNGGLPSENCAIAVAVRDIFSDARVGYSTISTRFGIIRHPNREFVTEFDKLRAEERVKMTPFDFYIDVPDSIIEKIGINEAIEIINKSDSLELVNQH